MTEPMIIVIACVRTDEGGPDFEAEAFRREQSKYNVVPCPECQAPMYLGTRSELLIRAGKARMACTQCVPKLTAGASGIIQTNLAQFMDPPK